ncbi:VanZ family protein [Desulfocurvus sp. DL9XJH121]
MAEVPPEEKLPRLFFALFAVGICCLVFLSLFSEFMPPYRRLYHAVSLDNVLHFLAFAMLSGVAPLAFRSRSKAFGSLFVLFLLGFTLEFWQLYLPNRRCELFDALANAMGICVGGFMGFWVRSRLRY